MGSSPIGRAEMHISGVKSLPINLDAFGFVEREYVGGKRLKNQCGRDFFYYVLNYYFPHEFNPTALNPQEITRQKLFGLRMPIGLIWTGLSFWKIPSLLRERGLRLLINGRPVTGFPSLFAGILPLRPQSYEQGIREIEQAVDRGQAIGVDIAISLGGLGDHVMFVYGYDEEYVYVFDTHQAFGPGYEKMTPPNDTRFIMKLPKSVIHARWTIFNRVWLVKKI